MSATRLLRLALAGFGLLAAGEIARHVVAAWAERDEVAANLARWLDDGRDGTDLERFARLTDLAARWSKSENEFVRLVSAVVLGSDWPLAGLPAGILSRALWVGSRRHGWPRLRWAESTVGRFGSSGFALADGSNQVQHFWFFVAASLALGRRLSEAGARYHEWNPPRLLNWMPLTGGGAGTAADAELSLQAFELASLLRSGDVAPEGVGAWLRKHLGNPESAGSQC